MPNYDQFYLAWQFTCLKSYAVLQQFFTPMFLNVVSTVVKPFEYKNNHKRIFVFPNYYCPKAINVTCK